MGIRDFFKSMKEGGQALKGEPVKDKVFSSEHEYTDNKTAVTEFKRSKDKLFNVDKWSGMHGLTSTFELYGEHGNQLPDAKVKEDHFIRIVMPGPSPENWVRVIELRDHKDVAYFVVSPSEDPTDKHNGKIEHFFVKEATSTFKVELKGKRIFAYEIGKNEGVNLGEYAGKRDIINILLSSGGWAGFQRIQWNNLTNYLVHLNE
ncbi:MAG: hypothetical protein WD038_00855 [Balneolales bacterium]